MKKGRKRKYKGYADETLLKIGEKFKSLSQMCALNWPLYREITHHRGLKGQLNGMKKLRSEKEVIELAKAYKTRGEMYNSNKNLYLALYSRGLLDKACVHMTPSRKKRKFVKSIPMYAKIIGEMFNHESFSTFSETQAYNTARRYGIDSIEIFEKKDDVAYLQNLIKKMFNDSLVEIEKEID